MHQHWLLQSRLSPPNFRVALIERPALVRLETEGLGHKAVVVCAPAGYGKTALLSQWRMSLQARGIATAWITLTPADTDPAHLLTYVTMSLTAAGARVGPLESLAEQWFADTPIPVAVASLAGHLARDTRPIALIIDDVHYAPRAVAEQVLGPLLQPGLPHLHLALSGRSRPSLPLAGLRSRGEVLEIEADALRFADTELASLLPELTSAQRSLLGARTEGWPVALQLARLWLIAKPERIQLIEGFSGYTTEVAEYLTEQVLTDLPAEIYRTLELTSPLDVVNSDVAAAVTGSAAAWPEVISLGALAHLVVPLDEARAWYRLHPLLTDYLRSRLRSRAPDLEVQCHSRASAWFESQEMYRESVQHAVAARDIPRAASLIEKTGGWELVLFGGMSLMRALLAQIPVEKLSEFPRVQLYRALLDAKSGELDSAGRHFEHAVRSIAPTGQAPALTTPVGRDLLVTRVLISRYQDLPIEADALSTLYADVEAIPPGDDLARATLLNAACLIGFGLGDMQAAYEACNRAVREVRKLGSILGVNYCSVHLGVATLHLGRTREAEAIFREASELAEENFGADSGLRAVADLHLAVALTTRGDFEGAAHLLDRSFAQVEAYDGWFDAYAEGYAAAISMTFATGNHQGVEEYIERGSATAARRGLARLERLMAAFRARMAVRTGQLDDARARVGWRAGEWRRNPFAWREHFAHGVATAELAILSGDFVLARAVLEDIGESATAGHRVRDARGVGLLRALVQFATGQRDEAAASVIEILEPALREDDTQFLLDPGELVVPLLQYTRQWVRDQSGRSLARQVISRALARLAEVRAAPPAGAGLLSARELEVLTELVQDSSNKVIARALQMTENTVKFHLKNIFQKLGVRHRVQAVRAARERGLIR